MDDVISVLEHALSQTHEPNLRQQLTDTIETLRKRNRNEGRRVPPNRDGRRPSQPNAPARRVKSR